MADDSARLQAYFGACLDRFGFDPRGVDWSSVEAQHARFAALMEIGDLDGATLLDAGCGLGHLYGYLIEQGIKPRYTGCDLSTPHIELARRAYPEARFVGADVRSILRAERFDYVIACGLLHLRVPRWPRWAWGLTRDMYASCTRGLVLTLPCRGAGHPPVLATVDPADWGARLGMLCPSVEWRLLHRWGDAVFLLRHIADTVVEESLP